MFGNHEFRSAGALFNTHKKRIRTIVALLITLMAVSFLISGCSKPNVVGTWISSWSYEGNQYDVTLSINSDGKYSESTVKNGLFHKGESGSWKLEGKEVVCDPDYEIGEVHYKYSGGKLINGDHKFTRV